MSLARARSLLPVSGTAGGLPATPPELPTNADLWSSSEPWIGRGRLTVLGLGAIALMLAFISISGAVVTSGSVALESSLKTLQHLEGGIVQKIVVRNGDVVQEGDLLVKLDDTQVRANLGVARGRYLDALTQKLRLEAERDGAPTFALPKALGPDLDDPHVVRMFEAQHALFVARRTSRTGEESVLRQRVAQLKSDLDGLDRQLEARTREFDLTSRELKNVTPLFEKGFIAQTRLGPLQRDYARLEGEVGRLKSDKTKALAAIEEADLKLAQSQKDFQSQVADELRKVESQLKEAAESRLSMEDKLARTEIRSPRAGRVHGLVPTTEGGVVAPGSAIAQIVPDGEKLIIEAKINPQDIDKVRGGHPAFVRFPGFNARTTPRLEGFVTTVSPAQLKDQDNQNRPYFMAHIELPRSELDKISSEHRLLPGMPAEVYIETNARSILSYIIKPIVDILVPLGRDG